MYLHLARPMLLPPAGAHNSTTVLRTAAHGAIFTPLPNATRSRISSAWGFGSA